MSYATCACTGITVLLTSTITIGVSLLTAVYTFCSVPGPPSTTMHTTGMCKEPVLDYSKTSIVESNKKNGTRHVYYCHFINIMYASRYNRNKGYRSVTFI